MPMRSHVRYCHLCQGHCGIEITFDDRNRIQSIRPDPDNAFSRGFICPKATALKYLHEDVDRLTGPLVRQGSEWLGAPWDVAFERTAREIVRIRNRYGPRSIAIFFGNAAAIMSGYLTPFPMPDAPLGRRTILQPKLDRLSRRLRRGPPDLRLTLAGPRSRPHALFPDRRP
jgi:hypothetical protein